MLDLANKGNVIDKSGTKLIDLASEANFSDEKSVTEQMSDLANKVSQLMI